MTRYKTFALRMFLTQVFTLISFVSFIIASPITYRGKSNSPKFPLDQVNKIKLKSLTNQRKDFKVSDIIKSKKDKTLLIFLTHLGDLTSFELVQKINFYLPQITENNINLACIAPGSISNAEKFIKMTNFPAEKLYLDNEAELYKILDFERGFLPDAKISPYLKLLPMLAGIGSPGTIAEVLRGYFGDRYENSNWIEDALRLVEREKFDVLGRNYQRPFELATVRLQNMIDVLSNWNELTPIDKNLITQLGGAYILKSDGTSLYEFKDCGILKYVNLNAALKTVNVELRDFTI